MNIVNTKKFSPLLILMINILFTGIQSFSKSDVNIRMFGAAGDGLTLCTDAIQSAIDSVYKRGGGIVNIPEGSFLTGSIILKSGVDLQLHKNATLIGSTNPLHYRKISDHLALILADNSNNISISGYGTIEGNGLELALKIDSLHHTGKIIDPQYNYRRMRPSESARPHIINFLDCTGIEIKNVTIQNGSGWVTKFKYCRNLNIDSITINSTAFWNNDGMDICDCQNVIITNCFVNSSDDGICLKSYSGESFNDSIYIANCTIRSSASAIKFGTDSYGGFTNIRIKKIKVYDTYRSAIAIESVDGAKIENIDISEITANNTGNAIFIKLGKRNANRSVGSIKKVTIRNLKASIPFGRPDIEYDLRGPDLPFFHNTFPSSITGIPGYNVENVTLENIEISYPGRATKGMAYAPLYRLDKVPENEKEYPEFSMFGELPSWGFFVRHVDGLKIENITLRVTEKDYRPAFVFDDARNITLTDIDINVQDKHEQVVFSNVNQCELENVKINGNNDYRILQQGNAISIKRR